VSFWEIDPKADPKELFLLGARFHGHPGPFLALGIRMGLLALSLVESRGHRDIAAEVETGTQPPISCIVDGIQVSTGCTPGKGNLSVKPLGKPAAVFSANGKRVRIEVRPEWLFRLEKLGAPDPLAEEVLRARAEELFTWTLF
jgi:formylmethanofuran dehydrogenase subunit E